MFTESKEIQQGLKGYFFTHFSSLSHFFKGVEMSSFTTLLPPPSPLISRMFFLHPILPSSICNARSNGQEGRSTDGGERKPLLSRLLSKVSPHPPGTSPVPKFSLIHCSKNSYLTKFRYLLRFGCPPPDATSTLTFNHNTVP
ncbi:hypothetical protein AVEN_25651-1 [Araneus ventricosus]|uniref:Uncharacterized protein n=1 Tax=Araneus ventricosus TaxID=182803 RepID=A0A4Y2BR44_ARAVE|nr:hypothetical protein AVEN_25651-1 [Araneus ventricosus]